MKSPTRTGIVLLICQVVFYTTWLLIVTGLVPRWGAWYSSSVPYRMQTEALLRGKLALSENPVDLDHDLAWSQQGVHQVWSIGVPLWRLPLEVVAKLLGFDAFPDRIAFGLFAALVAFLALRVWTTAWLSNSQQQRPSDLVWRSIVGFGVGFLLLLMFPPFLNLLQTRGAVWEEAVAYEYLFGVLLLMLLLAFSQRPTARGWYWLCALAGLGGLIRPPLVFYGFSTMAVALWIWIGDAKTNKEAQERQTKSRRQVGFVALGGVLLFCMGGGLLWGTNRLRFGDGFEFGHKLNMQDMHGSLYSTKFDYPFEEEPWARAAAELLGALFLATDNFNGNRWYEQNIFAVQSSTVRWRDFYFRTYDWTYALLVLLGWGLGFVWMGKVVWRRFRRGRLSSSFLFSLSSADVRWLGVLGWWSMLAALPLGIVFARDVEFVELDLERVGHARIEARVEDIRVKAGLEILERESVIRTEKGWRVRFRGPQARRWREGVQALFVAVVPRRFLAEDSTPWKLHSIRWRNNSP